MSRGVNFDLIMFTMLLRMTHQRAEPQKMPRTVSPAVAEPPCDPRTPIPAKMAINDRMVVGLVSVNNKVVTYEPARLVRAITTFDRVAGGVRIVFTPSQHRKQ